LRPARSKIARSTLHAEGTTQRISLAPRDGLGLGARSSAVPGVVVGARATSVVLGPVWRRTPLPTARSGLPSPFRSPIGTGPAPPQTPKSVLGADVPVAR